MRILTFDIEDWFHILDLGEVNKRDRWDEFESRIDEGIEQVINDLNQRELSATFFCLGWVAKKYPHIIRKINENGFDIASHSFSHSLVYEQDPIMFREDLKKSVFILEDLIGKKIDTYRAPGFSVTSETPWYIEEIVNMGITKDSSIFPASRGHGGFPNFGESIPTIINYNGLEIKEFPINLKSILGKSFIFSGGGYFRLLPKPILKRLFRKSEYIMTYFHMRDFDPNQPVLPMNIIRTFKSYYGLKSSWEKYQAILDAFEFIDLNDADRTIDWSNAPYIKL